MIHHVFCVIFKVQRSEGIRGFFLIAFGDFQVVNIKML